MAFSIQKRHYLQRKDKSAADYRYWEAKGWLDQGCRYYCDARVSRIKLAMAGLAGRAVAGLILK
jgi:hypothetical protein